MRKGKRKKYFHLDRTPYFVQSLMRILSFVVVVVVAMKEEEEEEAVNSAHWDFVCVFIRYIPVIQQTINKYDEPVNTFHVV